jgi:predicted ATPase
LAAEGVDILCLDEFAITNVADAAIFTELLRLLAERQLAVVCTTNRPPEDLYKEGLHRERYLPQLVNRIREDYIVIPIEGADYRQALLDADEQRVVDADATADKPAAASPVFFHGGDVDAALRTAVSGDASGDASPSFSASSVTVSWGRCLAVPGAANGVACFGFDDICRVPLSADDFMHVGLKFHTVFVHSIPRLSLEEHNEARRFTNLVDAMYEHSVRLVCHSTVPITEVLKSVEALREASDDSHDASRLGVFDKMYDDTPNFQLQIKELGSREKYNELKTKQLAAEMKRAAENLARQAAPAAVEGDVGSGWSAAPASADLSAPQEGVAGVMVAAVGSLQESGFAAARALSRLKEMQTFSYLEVARQRREAMM